MIIIIIIVNYHCYHNVKFIFFCFLVYYTIVIIFMFVKLHGMCGTELEIDNMQLLVLCFQNFNVCSGLHKM